MTKRNQIYKCEICGNIIEVLHEGADALVCCGQPMKLLEENTVDAALEKHVPVIEITDEDKEIVKVMVGETEHPMTEEHYIECIEVMTENQVLRKYLKPGEKPEKEFIVRGLEFTARAYCNLHGLWKSK